MIPHDWGFYHLEELGEFKNGINKSKDDFGFGVPFINLMDVFGKVSINANHTFGLVNATKGEINNYNLKKGDVLFIRSSVKPSGVGLTAVIEEDLNNIVYSGFIIRFREFKQLISLEFKKYIFHEKGFRQRLMNKSSISANTNINQEALNSLEVALPPLPEQLKISQILSTWDESIGTLENLINRKERYKRALMQKLLVGKKRFKEFKAGEWREILIKDLGRVVSGGTPDTTKGEYFNGEILWCTPTEITKLKGKKYISNTERRITELGLKSSSANILPSNSLIVCTRATVGDCAINSVEMSTNQGFKSIIPNEKIDIEFLYYLFLTMKSILLRLANGSTFLEISKTDFENIALNIPLSSKEQQKISLVLSLSDEEIQTLKKQLEHCKQQKKGLMQVLLTGKKRVKI